MGSINFGYFVGILKSFINQGIIENASSQLSLSVVIILFLVPYFVYFGIKAKKEVVQKITHLS